MIYCVLTEISPLLLIATSIEQLQKCGYRIEMQT